MPEPEDAVAAIVLAAGKSTRMKSDLPKVLHELCGRPLLAYVLDALNEAGVTRRYAVVGFGADQVRATFQGEPDLEFVLQAEQKGTGHAVMVCGDALAGHDGPVVVLAGDGPMIRPALIERMLERFHHHRAKAFLATAVVADPTGLGRIVRDGSGSFDRIVEQKDASPEEAAVREINASFYVFDCRSLFSALRSVQPNNKQGEYYLTDVPGILKRAGETVVAEVLADEIDMFGINHRRHLAEAHGLMQRRIQDRLMDSGVTIVDPAATCIDARAAIGRDTIIEPFSYVGPVKIGERCRIGPFAHLEAGTEIPSGTVVPGQFVARKQT